MRVDFPLFFSCNQKQKTHQKGKVKNYSTRTKKQEREKREKGEKGKTGSNSERTS